MLYFAPWKTALVSTIAVLGLIFAIPNAFDRQTVEAWPSWLPQQQVNLGLDLQGGSHLLLEMAEGDLIEELLDAHRDDVRQRLRGAGIRYANLRKTDELVRVRIVNQPDLPRAREALTPMIVGVGGGVFAAGAANNLTITQSGEDTLVLTPTREALTARVNSAIAASIATVEKRVNELGTSEPIVQRQGRARILVQVPGFDDPERLKGVLGQTAKLTFHEVHPSVSADQAQRTRVPPGYRIVPDADNPGFQWLLKSRPLITGEELVDSQPGFDQNNRPAVTFRFNGSGARKFGRYTQANVGRLFAIVLDNQAISVPEIVTPILGGSGQITGQFTPQQTTDLAVLLRSGALPAELTIVEERTVGPSLGADSIAAGEIAGVIGLGAVVAFIITTYGLFGVFATLALAVNIALILAALSVLQATLTLPGIAGIVLTIGMAVDANVLIYERIREELRSGKTAITAIDAGYTRAIGTILDANITTLIAAIILFWLGSGPIKGFAVTLSIGIFTSVFTAFVVSRLFIVLWLRSSRKSSRTVEVPI
ncbi:MAG: protein translocase subunit SecD [Pseudomonadota bacterium]